MKKRIPLILLVLICVISCKIDSDYNLAGGNINNQVNFGQQVAVPLGNFTKLKITSLLSEEAAQYFTLDESEDYITFDSQGESLTNFEFGRIEIAGLSLVDLEKTHIPKIKFELDVENSLPFDFSVICKIVDSLGVPVEGISSIIDADIDKCSDGDPSITRALINLSLTSDLEGVAFDGIVLSLFVMQMPTTPITMKAESGLALKNVVLYLPEGINFKVKKRKHHGNG